MDVEEILGDCLGIFVEAVDIYREIKIPVPRPYGTEFLIDFASEGSC